jgi:S1-C subfamily serine protease
MAYEDSFSWQPRPLPPTPPARRPSSSLVPLLVTVGVVALLVGGFLLVRSWWQGRESAKVFVQPEPITPRGDLTQLEKTNIQIYKDARPSVVHITTSVLQAGPYNLNVQEVPEGTGSGWVYSKDGYVVTNYHVVRNADAAQVTLADQSNYKASLVGVAPDKDIAVLRIGAPKDKLIPLKFGDSDKLQVGQVVYAIGNPFGLDQTLTTGIVSALGREIESPPNAQGQRRTIRGVIQTDAAINPGNSGGPLLDSAGLLIGMNTAIYSPSGASAGIGFAIPSEEIRRAVPQLINHRKITRPGLGIQVAADQLARHLKVPGVLIIRVLPGSPAEQSGLRGTERDEEGRLQLGDVITAIDGQKVKKVNDLFSLMEKYKVGDTVTLDVDRRGESMKVKVTLGEGG